MASIASDPVVTVPSRKWDPVVRITHWSIMAAIIVNGAVTEDGSAAHVRVGYGLAAVLALRLLWASSGHGRRASPPFRPARRAPSPM